MLAFWLKHLSQNWHLYCLSPVWTLMWTFKTPESINPLLHTWHLYGFSPLWILLCFLSASEVLNRLLQTLHSNGFSPAWIRRCTARWSPVPQHLPHSVHLYLLVWIFLWWLRLLCDTKHFPHSVHEYDFSPLCISLWSFKHPFFVNRLSHTVHTYGLGFSLRECSVMSLLLASVLSLVEVLPV